MKGTSFFSVILVFLFGVWLVSLWILSSIPGEDVHLPPFPGADKAAHFAYFLVGGFLLAGLLNKILGWRGWKLLGCVLCAMALIVNTAQSSVVAHKDRSGADPFDWIADCSGGALGAFMIGWVYARTRDRRAQSPSGVVTQPD